MIECERCKKSFESRIDVKFYGRPSDVDNDKAQNGEWLCKDCVGPRTEELDEAILKLKGFIGGKISE